VRVKLRPGTHFAPVPQGVYFTGCGPAFVLTAPAALYPVLDAQVGLLAAGTDLDELVAAVGNESARPVLDRVLRTLVQRDILLDLDGLGTGAPDAATATRYAEVLSYLEARCAEPYKAFAQLRSCRVGVSGGGPAVAVLLRALTRYGVEAVALSDVDGDAVRLDAVVVVEDSDTSVQLVGIGRSHPELPLLPIAARPGVALVGPELAGSAALADFLAVAARAGGWAVVEPELAAPRPLSAVLAGSLAGHAVLSRLVAEHLSPDREAGTPALTLVHGPELNTRVLPARPQPSASDAPDSATAAGAVDGDWPDASPASADETLTALAPLTARWTGIMRRGRDLDLAQMPLSLATVDLLPAEPTGPAGPGERATVDTPPTDAADRGEGRAGPGLLPLDAAGSVDPGERLAGWGADRAQAGLNAVLAGVRHWAGRRTAAPGEPAAGYSHRRWLLDGLLRCLAPDLVAGERATELGWAQLTRPGHRTLWSLCAEYFDRTMMLRRYALPGTGLVLAEAVDATGELRVAEWGYGPDAAIQHALGAAVAHAQAPAEVRAALAAPSSGTRFLELAAPQQLDPVVDQVRTLLREQGRRLAAERIRTDPVIGPLPVHCGRVWLS
jgi:hypothetical protein